MFHFGQVLFGQGPLVAFGPTQHHSKIMDTVETNLITLSRHVLHDQSKHKEATGDLTLLLASIQLGCKFVSSLVRKAGLANL